MYILKCDNLSNTINKEVTIKKHEDLDTTPSVKNHINESNTIKKESDFQQNMRICIVYWIIISVFLTYIIIKLTTNTIDFSGDIRKIIQENEVYANNNDLLAKLNKIHDYYGKIIIPTLDIKIKDLCITSIQQIINNMQGKNCNDILPKITAYIQLQKNEKFDSNIILNIYITINLLKECITQNPDCEIYKYVNNQKSLQYLLKYSSVVTPIVI